MIIMKKILLIIISIISLFILLIIVSKNSIINNTKDLLNTNLDSFYDYVNKYNYGNEGVVNITANYKGAHGSTNPINFEYNFMSEYKDNTLFTTLENNDGYYVDELSSNLINLFMKIRNNQDLKSIININNIKSEFNKIIFTFDVDNINKIFNTNVNNINLIVNTNILYLGINNYKLIIDDNEFIINKDFKELSNDNIRLFLNSNGYNINYMNKIRLNYNNKNNKEEYNLSINDCIISIDFGNSIKIKVNKEVSIYEGLEINIDFRDVDFSYDKKINRNDIPIYRYIDNANINIGG